MSGEFLKDIIQTIVFLLPVLALVWKGAKVTSRLEFLEENVKEKTTKFCTDHSNMNARIEQERKNTEENINAIMKTLSEIQQSIVRIETKLEGDKK